MGVSLVFQSSLAPISGLIQTTYPLSRFHYFVSSLSSVTCELGRLSLSFGINKIKMGHSKLALNWVPILVLVLMVTSISFVESSRKCLQVRTSTTSGNRETGGFQIKEADRVFGNAKVFSTVDDSDRLVPTGPNPLHHHNNPIKP